MASITRDYLIVGDKADNGAVIMTGSPCSTYHGKSDALDGSGVFCPACKTAGFLKCVGPRLSNMVDGVQKALSGDICICRCQRHPVFLAARSNYSMTVDTNADYCLHLGESSSTSQIRDLENYRDLEDSQDLEHYFEVVDASGAPVNLIYRIDSTGGKLHESELSNSGMTQTYPLETSINATFWKALT